MKRNFILLFLLFQFGAADAQKDLFLKEFNQANTWFFSHDKAYVSQTYYLYYDSLGKIPFDSSVCNVIKNNHSIHYSFQDFESFSDSSFTIRISHAQKAMFISRNTKPDSVLLNLVFNEGLSGFSSFEKSFLNKKQSCWSMEGGINGVTSVKMIINDSENKIDYLIVHFGANHPLIAQYKKDDEPLRNIILKIAYSYSDKIDKDILPELSDFITLNQNEVLPSLKFKEYTIRILN